MLVTWILAGALAGLAGVVYGASVGVVTPNLGFEIVLCRYPAHAHTRIGYAYAVTWGRAEIFIERDGFFQ